MGICQSMDLSPEGQASAAIDKASSKERCSDAGITKFLLLGAGDSGKSTLFKQLNNIYGNGYTNGDRKKYIPVLHNNLITSMQTLIEQARARHEVVFDGETLSTEIPADRLADCNRFMEIATTAAVTPHIAELVKRLWQLDAIRNVFKLRSTYQIPDSANYFFERADAYADANFSPSDMDMLCGRARTTGITDTTFEIPPNKFRIFDVGGQRNERRKWIHSFENVTAVIFVAALSEYNQQLFEDNTMHRMTEALTLFDDICNSRWFHDTPFVLFLNKSDLFKEKLKHFPISCYFDDYTGGPHDFDASAKHILSHFQARNQSKDREIYPHITCATDTTNVEKVFNAAKDIILRRALTIGGLQ